MKIYIDQPRGKEKLVAAFEQAGAEVVKEMSEDVKLIIPTVEETLPFFANAKTWFESKGVRVMVGSDYTIGEARDKAEFFRFCQRHGFLTPPIFQGNVIVKPRFGKGSKGIHLVDRSQIVQEYIDAPEVSIDYFADWQGSPLSVIPRFRMNVVNGESKDFEIVQGFQHYEVVKRLGTELGLVGHNVIQGFLVGNEFLFSEVNPRFGGGSHFTFETFNSPKWLMENL
jgi:carbamoyl-phosphate synthase large subunit